MARNITTAFNNAIKSQVVTPIIASELEFSDGTLRFFEKDLNPRVVKAHKGVVLCMATNGDSIFTGGDDGKFLKVSLTGDIQEIKDFETRWVDCVATYKGDMVCSSGLPISFAFSCSYID